MNLARTVASLLALDYPEFEILVVDNRTSESPTMLPKVNFPLMLGYIPLRNARAVRPLRAIRVLRCRLESSLLLPTTTPSSIGIGSESWGARFALSEEVEAIGSFVLPMDLETVAQLWFEEYYGGFSPSFLGSQS